MERNAIPPAWSAVTAQLHPPVSASSTHSAAAKPMFTNGPSRRSHSTVVPDSDLHAAGIATTPSPVVMVLSVTFPSAPKTSVPVTSSAPTIGPPGQFRPNPVTSVSPDIGRHDPATAHVPT